MYSTLISRLLGYMFVLSISLPSILLAQSTVNLTLDDGSMDEEFLGTGGFTVTRDGSTTQAINVFVEMSGSAVYNADYTYINLTGYSHPTWYVRIPAGQNSASVTLTPLKDNFNEGVETLAFNLLESKPGNGDYFIGNQVLAEMAITDDVAEVILTLDDASMDEEFLGTGGFTVTRDDHGNKTQAINVFVEMSGSAAYNTDYTYINLTGYSHPTWYVRIPAGLNSASVTLTPVKDFIIEGDESLAFTLLASKPGNGDYIVGDQVVAEMTIFDLVDKIFSDSFEDQ
jgi:hypothetical protein